MYTYKAIVKINPYQSVDTRVQASNDYAAKALLEAQYGVGNVLSYTKIDD